MVLCDSGFVPAGVNIVITFREFSSIKVGRGRIRRREIQSTRIVSQNLSSTNWRASFSYGSLLGFCVDYIVFSLLRFFCHALDKYS